MNLKKTLMAMATGLPMMAFAAGGHGVEKANLDPSVKPGDDFYQYACGGWMKANPLPAEFSRFGTFDQLRETAREQLKDVILNLSKNPESKVKGTNAQKVSDLYAMAMDSTRLNREGAAPLKATLEHIEKADTKDLARLLTDEFLAFCNPFFGSGVGTDAKNSNVNAMHIGEAGLGLSDRDYYLEESETNAKIMEAYETYIKRIMTLAGKSDAEAERIWETLVRTERKFAEAKMTREQRRNPQARYNEYSVAKLQAEFPYIDWKAYFSNLGTPDVDRVIVASPQFMKALNEILPSLTDREIKDLVTVDAVSGVTGLLSDDFYDASFELYDRVMSGKEEKEPRWKRAMGIPNSMFGEAVGELYVAKYFPEESKQYMKGLVENLRVALGKHIDNLTWMSDATKAKAQEKLAGFVVKIGYPDKWKDYSGIDIDPELPFMENVRLASIWYQKDNLAKLKKPVDRDEWHMTPQTVNAYYNPTTNEICFPAGILQAPYFDMKADDACNYGAIGVVIGHEMTHGFDDSGRQYDKDGNLNDWWQPADAEAFKKLADALVAQFDEVEVAPGVHANGRFTLGENIADQGGLRVALTAYQDAAGDKAEDIDGLSPLQRFYLAYANVWAANIRDAEILSRTKTDSHSLGRNRVNVSLRNIEPFFGAFGIKEGDPMFRPESERVVIW